MKQYLIFLLLISFNSFSQSLSENYSKNIIDLKLGLKETINEPNNYKSPYLAFLYSFLLPGMGELYSNNFNSGKYFTIAEGVLWTTLLGFNHYGNIQKDNYKNFARIYGNAEPSGKNDDYFANLANYNSINDFNREKYLNRDFDKVYNLNDYYWDWTSSEIRREYRGIWLSSEQAYTNMNFVIAGLILNRIISGINAVISAISYNENNSTESNITLKSFILNSEKSNLQNLNIQISIPF